VTSIWQEIYSHFDPVAFRLFDMPIHWYGICYAFALISVYFVMRWLAEKDKLPFTKEQIDNYFFWAEIGVILGGRLGFVLFYDTHTIWYLTHPWQIFNPFMDGQFIGIRGFSYHGGLAGFLAASYLFCKREKVSFWILMDLAAVSVGFGYFFGRIGNFLNKELVGRVTDSPFGIVVDGILRHPSQLYEAVLEGALIFGLMLFIRSKKRFDGELAMIYGVLYGLFRTFCEFFREPDIQLGYILSDWLTIGMILSLIIVLFSVAGYAFFYRKFIRR
jgi:phosphatidylglycerol---prolipoprotein diacylglyceryl transferase